MKTKALLVSLIAVAVTVAGSLSCSLAADLTRGEALKKSQQKWRSEYEYLGLMIPNRIAFTKSNYQDQRKLFDERKKFLDALVAMGVLSKGRVETGTVKKAATGTAQDPRYVEHHYSITPQYGRYQRFPGDESLTYLALGGWEITDVTEIAAPVMDYVQVTLTIKFVPNELGRLLAANQVTRADKQVRNIMRNTSTVREGKQTFRQYDDGWRVEE